LLTQKLGLPPREITPKGKIRFTGKILDELIEAPSGLRAHFDASQHETDYAINSVDALRRASSIGTQINTFIGPLQKYVDEQDDRLHFSLNLNTETGRLSCSSPNLQNQPSSKDIFKVRKSFTPQTADNTLIIADYAQIELRVLAYLSNCQSMIDAFESGGDFHSRTAASMYPYIQADIAEGMFYFYSLLCINIPNSTCFSGGVLMDGKSDSNIPLVKDKYKRERIHAKMVNFSIAYGKTAQGLASDLDISIKEANQILEMWYSDRAEVRRWQHRQMITAIETGFSYSLIGRPRRLFDPLWDLCDGDGNLHKEFQYFVRVAYNFNGDDDDEDDEVHEILDDGDMDYVKLQGKDLMKHAVKNRTKGKNKKMSYLWNDFMGQWKKENVGKRKEKTLNVVASKAAKVPLNQYMRRAINSPVQSGAADIVVKAMLNIWEHKRLKQLGFKLLLQIHDEVILEGPIKNVEEAKKIVKECMETPWNGMKQSIVFRADVKHSDNWYDGK